MESDFGCFLLKPLRFSLDRFSTVHHDVMGILVLLLPLELFPCLNLFFRSFHQCIALSRACSPTFAVSGAFSTFVDMFSAASAKKFHAVPSPSQTVQTEPVTQLHSQAPAFESYRSPASLVATVAQQQESTWFRLASSARYQRGVLGAKRTFGIRLYERVGKEKTSRQRSVAIRTSANGKCGG